MAKQTFTAGQVLTAAEMNSLQENDYNWTVTTKTASYTLAAGDEGTRIVMNNAGATTITVNDAVFAAGDTVWVHNIGAGTCTVTAGTATVNADVSLDLAQYQGGQLYFTAAGSAIYFPAGGPTSIRLITPREKWNVSATAATGTVNMDITTSTAWYYTSDASANWTFNFRGDASTTLDSLIAVGDSVTVAFLVTNGATAYYPSAFQIDGSSVTPIWSGGSAPSAGNADSVDAYVFTIIKTAATPTYEVVASLTAFA
jgi:hypothetical protein